MVLITPGGEAPPYDRRRAKRWPARATCGVRSSTGGTGAVTLSNISEGGFGAVCDHSYVDGDELIFRLGRAGHAPARVVWRIGPVMGCEFLRDVSAAEVALTIATASPAPLVDPSFQA